MDCFRRSPLIVRPSIHPTSQRVAQKNASIVSLFPFNVITVALTPVVFFFPPGVGIRVSCRWLFFPEHQRIAAEKKESVRAIRKNGSLSQPPKLYCTKVDNRGHRHLRASSGRLGFTHSFIL